MSIRDYLSKDAQEVADSAKDRIADLDRQLADIEKKKADIDAKRAMARGALQRLANYPVTNGGNYLCPICWVDEGKMSPLAPIPSQTRDDLFRCRMCHYDAVIPG